MRTRDLATGRAALALALAAALTACDGKGKAIAERISDRAQLVGGPDALGDIGDLRLANGKVRFVVQGLEKSRYSRGWGVFAGSLLDADLVRPNMAKGSVPNGNDRFGELFPAYFLDSIEPDAIRVGNDGADGNPATIVVSGTAAPFLSMVGQLLDIVLAPGNAAMPRLQFETVYSLGPEDQFLTVTSTLWDDTGDHKFPNAEIMGIKLAVPFGQVLLFGARNDVFVPGAGFDVRYSLEDAYKTPPPLPGLPGLVTDIVATRGHGTSYGFAAARPPEGRENENYTWRTLRAHPATTPETMLVPFFATAFTGVFVGQPPDRLPRGERFSWTTYLIVGHGDVGSVRDVQFELQRRATGRFVARALEEQTLRPLPDASVLVLDEDGRPFSQYTPDETGTVSGKLPPGTYKAVVVQDNRRTTLPKTFAVEADKTTETAASGGRLDLLVGLPARVSVRVSDENGQPLPAKVSVLGVHPHDAAGREPRRFLFDLALGERFLSTDGVPDSASDAGTRQYLERVILAGADGRATGEVRPGSYVLVVSRGPEYETRVATPADDRDHAGMTALMAGGLYDYSVTLRRVLETPGAVSADLHVHTSNSIDGHIGLHERVLSYVAEGVEYLAATDHNFLTDLQPWVEKARLADWLKTDVGLEMTTLEMGHFNAFPLLYKPGAITHGSIDWVNTPPDLLFQALRAIGTPDTIVQVNHPRDTIMGYFNQFNVDPDPLSPKAGQPRPGNLLASPQGPAFDLAHFSYDYDAMEVFNGKRQDLIRTFRMPAVPPPAPYPAVPAQPGDLVREPCPEDTPGCDYAKQPIAFPGAVDDWFILLNKGHPITATGNSDSHGLYLEEAGNPRNWVFVGADEQGRDRLVRDVTPSQVSAALRAHRNVLSNGPWLQVSLQDADGKTWELGALASKPKGPLKLRVRVEAAPWVGVDKVTAYINGDDKLAHTWDTAERRGIVRLDETWQMPAIDADRWIVVEASSTRSLWPFVTPLEQPPIAISDAVGAIAGPLGLGEDGMGNLRPAEMFPVTPYALTNPIWIDQNGDGVSYGRGAEGLASGSQPLAQAGAEDAKATVKVPEAARPRRPSDLRKLLRAWGGH